MTVSLDDRGTRHLGAGMTFVASAGLFGLGGYWLDTKLGTLPVFLVLGMLCGFAGGLIHLLRIAAPELLPFGKKNGNDNDNEDARAGESSPSPDDDDRTDPQ